MESYKSPVPNHQPENVKSKLTASNLDVCEIPIKMINNLDDSSAPPIAWPCRIQIIWSIAGEKSKKLEKSIITMSGWWFQPLWKIWVRQLGFLFLIYGKIKMFQTTNQM